MNNDILHIIIPFFSFNNIKIRKQNLERTLNCLKSFENIHVTIVNGSYQGESLENEGFIKHEKFSYIKYDLPSVLWVKENLINLAIKSLPQDWEYVCWIDSDIIFLNPNWTNETIQNLKTYDVVQLYKTVAYLNENGDFDLNMNLPYHKPLSPGFVYKCLKEKRHVFAPTGFGWGINKNFYNRIVSFFEFGIVGGGDFIFAVAATQSYEFAKTSASFKDLPSKNYSDKLISYYELFKDCKTSYINGLICHQWHGDLTQRQYEPRWNIVLKNKFDPEIHVSKNVEGVIYLNSSAQQFEKEIIEYFKKRND
jgi:hypothetical protein